MRFRKQVALGSYIADFYAHAARLVIEIDGSSHQGDRLNHDRHRDRWMEDQGLFLLRFMASDVFSNLEGVTKEIEQSAMKQINKLDEKRRNQ